MNREEASRIARIIGSADGGCSPCVSALVDKLNEADLGWTFFNAGKELLVKSDWDPEYRNRVIYVKAEPTQ